MFCIDDHRFSKKSCYFRYFNGKLRNGRPEYGHNRHHRLQIKKNQRFIFRFSQISMTGDNTLRQQEILDALTAVLPVDGEYFLQSV